VSHWDTSCGVKTMLLPKRLRDVLPKSKSKEDLDKHYEGLELEKGDFLAMVIAAFITFIPLLIIIMGMIYGLLWLLFIR
jgi:hypothetical protein